MTYEQVDDNPGNDPLLALLIARGEYEDCDSDEANSVLESARHIARAHFDTLNKLGDKHDMLGASPFELSTGDMTDA